MNLLKKIFYFYINSSIHVAIAVCAFAMITVKEFDLENSISLMCFIFFGTITGYSFIKYVAFFAFPHRLAKSNHRFFQRVIILLGIGTLFCLFQLTFEAIITTLILSLFTLLYAVPFLKNKSLRHFNGLKIFIVALVWAGVTVLVPYLNEFNEVPDDVIVGFIQRFLIVLALMLPFEIRDLSVDASYLKTLPQQVGVLQTKLIGMVILILCFFLEFMKDTFNETFFYSLVFIVILIALCILFAQKKQSKYFASF
ncbi:MAG: hypothetical protein KUG68_10100, partial [Flavobacteriaceae bacterium]|nr:hypothetical protein [Flavobacteriaceae bacterium]